MQMMRNRYETLSCITVLMLALIMTVGSCGSGSSGGGGGSSSSNTTTTTTSTNTGWHNQGRDCLYCHNTDLSTDKHLLIAGTIFKTVTVSDVDNTANACNATVHVQFVDRSFNVVYDSSNYTDTASIGNNGSGNTFILLRRLSALTGDYYMKLVTSDNVTIGHSRTLHSFTSAYDRSTPSDLLNRYSCNACHTAQPQNGADGYLYPNIDSSKCN